MSYGARMYDNRVGRFTGVDPIADEFAFVSSFNYAENSPIANIDLWGLQAVWSSAHVSYTGEGRKFAQENPGKAVAGALVLLAPPVVFAGLAEVGPATAGAFVLNEVKDELLSTATGGVSDYVDVSKMATKGARHLWDKFRNAAITDIDQLKKIKGGDASGGNRNGHFAGGEHPKTGVPFDDDGFPDFSDYLYDGSDGLNDVNIGSFTGNRVNDFKNANEKAGFGKGAYDHPDGYTWHHHQENGKMQLVDKEKHKKTGHTGGHSIHKDDKN